MRLNRATPRRWYVPFGVLLWVAADQPIRFKPRPCSGHRRPELLVAALAGRGIFGHHSSAEVTTVPITAADASRRHQCFENVTTQVGRAHVLQRSAVRDK